VKRCLPGRNDDEPIAQRAAWRRRSLAAYRLGYAESANGIDWIRKDEEMGLDVSPGEFDSDAIMYSAIISVGDRTYCFYNGNNFGEHGFGLAELIA
jgi:hypothetical protein